MDCLGLSALPTRTAEVIELFAADTAILLGHLDSRDGQRGGAEQPGRGHDQTDPREDVPDVTEVNIEDRARECSGDREQQAAEARKGSALGIQMAAAVPFVGNHMLGDTDKLCNPGLA